MTEYDMREISPTHRICRIPLSSEEAAALGGLAYLGPTEREGSWTRYRLIEKDGEQYSLVIIDEHDSYWNDEAKKANQGWRAKDRNRIHSGLLWLLSHQFPILYGCGKCQSYHSKITLMHRCNARTGLITYRCGVCKTIYTPWTGTPLQGTHRTPEEIVYILRGMVRRTPTIQLAAELRCDRKRLGLFRKKLEEIRREHIEMWYEKGEVLINSICDALLRDKSRKNPLS